VLNWSNAGYKLTIGIGSLALAGMMTELWKPILPLWLLIAVTLIPIAIFVFVRPRELPARIVRFAHVAASLWYLVLAVVLLVAFFQVQQALLAWVACFLLVLVGSIPFCLVLQRSIHGKYDLIDEEESRQGATTASVVDQKEMEIEGDREYPYKPSWMTIVCLGVFFGLCSVGFGYLASNNQRGLIINGLIEFSPENATLLYWLLWFVCVSFVVLAGVVAIMRVVLPQRVVVTQTALILPKSRWSSEEISIQYQAIISLATSEVSGQRFLHVAHSSGKHYVNSSFLPSKAAFEEICEMLAKRMAQSST
jgi:hypothetical protein